MANGLVYQTSDVKYVIATNNLWASPLDQQLQQTLIANLSQALPGRVVAASPHGEGYDTLNVSVSGFQAAKEGETVKKAIIAGAMLLLAGCSTTIDTTYYQLPAGSSTVRVASSAGSSQPMLWVEHVNVPDYLAGC
ncbi:hypothetical protein CRX72_13905 [Pantoea sp. BRM17]|nr:hypothetical protein CRX72_13905 [Pantoea sp. BRM17]